ncbi:sphingomyelin phosphodiesterase, putative [Hepatocystis sp. ex Piliocolobus tephrosceles]|nr:sphingomyelin phosphodiesterase, putative [Hepatocystis sp. ex Piliocolobus tephrosceles]
MTLLNSLNNKELTIMSYNVQLLNIPLTNKVNFVARQNAVIDYINMLDNKYNIDVLVLNEVFTNETYNILTSDAMKKRFPYHTNVVGNTSEGKQKKKEEEEEEEKEKEEEEEEDEEEEEEEEEDEEEEEEEEEDEEKEEEEKEEKEEKNEEAREDNLRGELYKRLKYNEYNHKPSHKTVIENGTYIDDYVTMDAVNLNKNDNKCYNTNNFSSNNITDNNINYDAILPSTSNKDIINHKNKKKKNKNVNKNNVNNGYNNLHKNKRKILKVEKKENMYIERNGDVTNVTTEHDNSENTEYLITDDRKYINNMHKIYNDHKIDKKIKNINNITEKYNNGNLKKKKNKKGYSNFNTVSGRVRFYHVYNGGVMVLAKFKILHTHALVYSACKFPDAFSSKGAIYLQMQIGGKKVNIVATHLQAGETYEHEICRRQQLKELSGWLKTGAPSNLIEKGAPLFFVGDFNIKHDIDKNIFTYLLSGECLNSSVTSNSLDTTYDSALNDYCRHLEKDFKNKYKCTLDYIFVCNDSNVKTIVPQTAIQNSFKPLYIFKPFLGCIPLGGVYIHHPSDHFPIYAKFLI